MDVFDIVLLVVGLGLVALISWQAVKLVKSIKARKASKGLGDKKGDNPRKEE